MSDVRVLRTQGLESESPLAFAALNRLLRPFLDLAEGLPAPQARALGVAFGQEVGTVEPFLVSVATLSVLTEPVEEQPVVCVVDDAQSLDSASTDALLFATRRLDADSVAMMFAARDTDDRHVRPRRRALPAAGRVGRRLGAGVACRERSGRVRGRGERPAPRRDRRESAGARRTPTGSVTRSWPGLFRAPQLMLTADVERVFVDRSVASPRQPKR